MTMATVPRLSVIVVFHNMRREARRTLHSLTDRYQRGVSADEYEVIAIDSASTEPLDAGWVNSLAPNLTYVRWETSSKSPTGALNHGVERAAAPLVMCLIDGARILSPGMLHWTLEASKLDSHPFIYSLAMHIGHKSQNDLVEEGYDREQEDELLATIDWQANGYRLFTISSVAGSSKQGFFSALSESNCFAMTKADYGALGGLDVRFDSPGGGLVNLDFFNRVNAAESLRPIMLLGEATFHQFHGGVATNAPASRHPWNQMAAEYEAIKGRPFTAVYRRPEYLGCLPDECRRFLKE
jgi:hypothetical protein